VPTSWSACGFIVRCAGGGERAWTSAPRGLSGSGGRSHGRDNPHGSGRGSCRRGEMSSCPGPEQTFDRRWESPRAPAHPAANGIGRGRARSIDDPLAAQRPLGAGDHRGAARSGGGLGVVASANSAIAQRTSRKRTIPAPFDVAGIPRAHRTHPRGLSGSGGTRQHDSLVRPTPSLLCESSQSARYL
jgi:hypothetical protein